jgi:hypothetical protein
MVTSRYFEMPFHDSSMPKYWIADTQQEVLDACVQLDFAPAVAPRAACRPAATES